MFQSTRPRGARRSNLSYPLPDSKVSIHAPTRGATTACKPQLRDALRFQSTRPRGARRGSKPPASSTEYGFNPRAHAGRDTFFNNGQMPGEWFQSTRPRGARPAVNNALSAALMFQSTRPRGARHQTGSRTADHYLFQSTRPRGARPPGRSGRRHS